MKTRFKKLWRNKELILLATPGFIWFVVFSFIPLFGILVAFKKYTITSGNFFQNLINSPWVGFDNFKFLFASNDTLIMLRNTICYNIIFIALSIIIPVIVSICLTELLSPKLTKVLQSLMFFPYFVSWVVVSYFVLAFLDPTKGLVSKIIMDNSGQMVNFYLDPKVWPFILIFLNVWKGLGYGVIIYMSAILGIDRTYYEAAMIDGASKFKQIWYITLPLLKSVMIILGILGVSKIMFSDFGLFYQVPQNSSALFSVTQTVDTYVYRAMTQMGQIGMSSAASVFQSFVGFIMVLIANLVIRKVDSDSALF